MLSRKIKQFSLFLIFLYVFLVKTGYTDADIFAERLVQKNKFTTISLDFTTNNSYSINKISSLFQTLGIRPNGFDLGAIKVKGDSNKDFKYHLKTVVVNGDHDFCNELKVQVLNRRFWSKYSGSLTDLSLNYTIDSNEEEDLIFVVSLDNDDPKFKNKICNFNFDLRTYRDKVDEQGGIFAQRIVSNIVSSGNW